MAEVPARGWSSSSRAEMADVVLLRHGATKLTPQKRFSGVGAGDPGLSAAGFDQARRAASSPLLRKGTFVGVLCSPMKRCRETAELIAAELDLPLRIEAEWREMDFGMWEGMTFDEVQDRYPDDLRAWKESPEAAPTGSTETFAGVLERMGTLAQVLSTRYADRSVLAVTHVTPIKALVAHALGAPPQSLFRMELSAACFSRIAYSGQEASLKLLNDTSHLY
ncbi:MAG: histidine phosphatase family protein [Humibacillus sp.]